MEKTMEGFPENPHAIFPFDLFDGYRNLDGIHDPGREGELENIFDKTFFKCARVEGAKAQTYRLVIVPSYSPS
jgi:hypothetical protein